jgi:excisionase family DNA binding protein
VSEPIKWIGTPEACARLGVTLRTLYRFIDEGQLPAYKMGRVIRLQAHEVDAFIEKARIVPGTLEHLYPDPRGRSEPVGDEDEVTTASLVAAAKEASGAVQARGEGDLGQ